MILSNFIMKRIVSYWRTYLTMATGLTIMVAIVCSIVLFTNGSFQGVLRETEQKLAPGDPIPGTVMLQTPTASQDQATITPAQFDEMNQFIQAREQAVVGLPTKSTASRIIFQEGLMKAIQIADGDLNTDRSMSLAYSDHLYQHIKLVDGKWPGVSNDPHELDVLVATKTLEQQQFSVGSTFRYAISGNSYINIHIVGAFELTSITDLYWYGLGNQLTQVLFIDPTQLSDIFSQHADLKIDHCFWVSNFDYNQLSFSDVSKLVDRFQSLRFDASKIIHGIHFTVDPIVQLRSFEKTGVTMQSLLLSVAVPTLFLVGYYVFMMSTIVLDRRRNELAVLHSRGGSVNQLVGSYILELLLIGLVLLGIGICLAFFFVEVIASASGFMSFENRGLVPIIFSPTVVLYGLLTVFCCIGVGVVPAVAAASITIVYQKNSVARGRRMPVWERFGIDFMLAAFCIYQLHVLQTNKQDLINAASDGTAEPLNMMVFLGPGIAIISLGMVVIRVFPWLIRSTAWITAHWGGVALALGLRQLGRASYLYRPLLLLLVITVGIGGYSVTSAHTMNQNLADHEYYQAGSDVVLGATWNRITVAPSKVSPSSPDRPVLPGNYAGSSTQDSHTPQANTVYSNQLFIEPSFQFYKTAPGVEHSARVFRTESPVGLGAIVPGYEVVLSWDGVNSELKQVGTPLGGGTLLAIDPADFADTMWFRPDLAPDNYRVYLRTLALHPDGVIVSKDFFQQHHLKLGDVITLYPSPLFGYGHSVNHVVGYVPSWPSIAQSQNSFFLVNMNDFVSQVGHIEPYEVWLKLKPDAKVQPVLDYLHNHGINAYVSSYPKSIIQQMKVTPEWVGVMGMLTLDFVTAIIVTVLSVGFYGQLLFQRRAPIFGALRAIGLSVKQLINVVLIELGVLIGLGMIAGTAAGMVTGLMFLPDLGFNGILASMQKPKFVVEDPLSDWGTICSIILVVLILDLLILAKELLRMRIHEAVKLGDDV